MSERASERDNDLIQPDDYIELGNRQSHIGNALGALAAYDRAVCLAPSYADAYNYRGSFKFAHLGDIQGATAEDGARASPISMPPLVTTPIMLLLMPIAACLGINN
jgi:hypothetical protein